MLPVGQLERENLSGIDEEVSTNFKAQDTDGLTVGCRAQALDPFSAATMANRVAENYLAVRRLYSPQKQSSIHPTVLVTNTATDRTEPVAIGPTGPELVPKAHDIETKVSNLVSLSVALNRDDQALFAASIQYYRLMLHATTNEARMINLWIALEALFQTMGRDAILTRIVAHVPSIMALHYVSDVLRALAKDMSALWKRSETSELRRYLPHSNSHYLNMFDLGVLLTKPEEAPSLRLLLSLAAENPLMVFRISKLRETLFTSPAEMAKSIDRHRANVEWQLRRIYRLRNTITHQGRVSNNAVQLIEHLQQYFLATFHDLFHTIRVRGNLSIPEALDSRRHDFSYLLSRLKDPNGAPLTMKFVSLGYPSVERDRSSFLWREEE